MATFLRPFGAFGVCLIIFGTVSAPSPADEVISRAWTIQNVLEPTFTEAISRADTIQNVLEPTFTEAISRANSPCNIGIFVDEDNDTVHDCFDVCPGGNDLIDNDNNDIPDACEPGSCCFMTGGFPACFNSNKLECESPPFSGVYGGEGSVCDQNVAIIHEPGGQVFVHVIGPPADCGPATPPPCNGSGNPPYNDAWASPTTGLMCHSFNPADGGTPIPAGFFAPGSDPFMGSVCLHGVPLNNPNYPGADTIVRRHGDPFDLCTPGTLPMTESVPIEIVALSLASNSPMVVTFGGANPQNWNVTVALAPNQPPMGALTATKEHCNGGTYTSMLNVWPFFTFQRQSDGILRGLIPPTYMTFNQSVPAPWVHDVNPVFDAAVDPCSKFHAGIAETTPPTVCGSDSDGDGVRVECDNCANAANPDQSDVDGDGIGDACDPCPIDNPDDSDGDTVCDSNDVCPGFDDAIDPDGDGDPAGCDNCPYVSNSGQEDTGGVVGVGDACDCGVCQDHGDIAPLPVARCIVDVDDLLCALDSFSGIGVCGAGVLGDIVVSGGGCGPDGTDDVDDILSVLNAFSGTYDCPAPCPAGACIGDFTGAPAATECRDGDELGAFFVGNGMSESDCFLLTNGTGSYCGNFSVCTSPSTCTLP